MPNWVDNELTVSGPKERLEEFKQKVAGDEGALDANKIIPYPPIFTLLDKLNTFYAKDEKKEPVLPTECDSQVLMEAALAGYNTKRDGYNQGGYDWCIANWGTRWGFSEAHIIGEDDTQILYSFATAWSPPLPLIARMGRMFPELEFKLRYYEVGMSFQGCLHIKDGQVIEDWIGDYKGDRGG